MRVSEVDIEDLDEAITGAATKPSPRWLRNLSIASYALAIVSAIGLGLMVVHITLDVAGRTGFRNPLPGTLEFVQYVYMPVIALCAMAMAERMGQHPRVTVLLPADGTASRRAVDIIGQVTLIVVVGLLFYSGIGAAEHSIAIDESVIAAINVPVWPAKVIAVIAFGAFLLQAVVVLIELVLGVSRKAVDDDEAA